MQKGPVASTPDAYVAALDGWRRDLVESLRAGVLAAEAAVGLNLELGDPTKSTG